MLAEDASRNKCFFFKARILHVLRYISICDLLADSPSYEEGYGKNFVSVQNVNAFWFPGCDAKSCVTVMYTRIQPNINSTYSASRHQTGQVHSENIFSVSENIVSVAHIIKLKITNPQHPGNSS
jgi:hypothetical protein